MTIYLKTYLPKPVDGALRIKNQEKIKNEKWKMHQKLMSINIPQTLFKLRSLLKNIKSIDQLEARIAAIERWGILSFQTPRRFMRTPNLYLKVNSFKTV
jgi:hypothetical protein